MLAIDCFIFITAETSQNGSTCHAPQNGGANTPHAMVNQTMAIMPISAPGAAGGVPGPTTNLNIGMDYWGAPTSSAIPALRGKVPPPPVAGGIVAAGSRDSVQSQIWLQVLSPSLYSNTCMYLWIYVYSIDSFKFDSLGS